MSKLLYLCSFKIISFKPTKVNLNWSFKLVIFYYQLWAQKKFGKIDSSKIKF